MKKIYIVLSYTGSLPSRLIRQATKKKYTHVSISLDKELTQMYSFGRKYNRLPIPGGFVKEDINKGLYIKKGTLILIKEMQVNNRQYINLLKAINEFNDKITHYDYKGAIGVYLNKDMFDKDGYVCSSFVNQILQHIGIETNKGDWEIQPEDFNHLSNTILIYEGMSSRYLTKL